MIGEYDDIIATEFHFIDDLKQNDCAGIRIVRISSPFYESTRWAVRRANDVLRVNGGWEYEPLPSNRDNAFYARCRFINFDKAVKAARRERLKLKEAKDGRTHST
jgi:hypothetical protein